MAARAAGSEVAVQPESQVLRCSHGRTPTMTREGLKLLRAANDGGLAQIAALLEAGTDVNEANKKGTTPLHFAADNGHVEAVRTLLDRQANVNARTQVGLTPLMVAARSGHPGVVRLLLEAGADASVQVDQVPEAGSYAGQDALSLPDHGEALAMIRAARL